MLVPVLPSLGLMAGTAPRQHLCRHAVEKDKIVCLLSLGLLFLEAMSACELEMTAREEDAILVQHIISTHLRRS
jgi:hypothetical protein